MSTPVPSFRSNNGNEVTDRLLFELAEHLHPSDYRPLGLRLGFTETRLSQIESSRHGIIDECMYQMLVEWKRREGQHATLQTLVQSVKESGNAEAADWLHSEVDQQVTAVRSNSIDEKLNEGNVPALPDCLTDRDSDLAEVREKLRRAALSDKPGRWVVVYGMGGMGKTVLVNQAVRDAGLVEEYFPDGVFWMSMGSVKDKDKIPERLETLCRIFDSDLSSVASPPKTLEQWKHLLTKLLAQRYPKSLLVLDDVWIQFVVCAFDVRCTVLITTRDSGITSRVSGYKEEHNLSEGLSQQQALKALAEWTNTSATDLPPEAELIHKFSKGSPLVIAIVGALLRDFPDRWPFYVKKMETKNLQQLSSDSSYEYCSVYEAIEMSLEQLSPELLELYSWFAVFDEGTMLSSKVLGMLVGCSKEDVEDKMRVITQRSLATPGWSQEEKCRSYSIHDLLHDHLVARGAAKDKDPKLCNEFKSLMIFLRFRASQRDIIQTGLCLQRSTSVFKSAKKVAESTKGGFFVTEIADSRPVVYGIRHRPGRKYTKCARLLANGMEVVTAGYEGHVKITNIISGSVRLEIQAHTDSINDIVISQDGALLVTCSSDKTLSIWNIGNDSEGQLVKTLSHENTKILCCTFVVHDKSLKLVSGDESGCLRIWDSNFALQHTIKAHTSSILACSTDADEGTVITCGKNDSDAKVFSLSTGQLKMTLEHEDDVQGVAYLSNGLIVTLTWCELNVFNNRGRSICKWTSETENNFLDCLACATSSDRHFIAVRTITGLITVFKLSRTFMVTRKLSPYCQLDVGGIYREASNMWLTSIDRGDVVEEGLYLVTRQECGLILIWKLVKEEMRNRLSDRLYDVCFSPDGHVEYIVGQAYDDKKQCTLLQQYDDRTLFKLATNVYKASEFETVNAVDVHQAPGRMIIHTDKGLQISTLHKTGKSGTIGIESKRTFTVTPADDKVLLAQLIGDRNELLTVSTGVGIYIEIWSSDKNAPPVASRQVTSHQGLSADLSHDKRKIAVGCPDGTVLLFCLTDNRLNDEEPIVLQGPPSRVSCCEFSSDGKLLALAGWKHAKVFKVDTQKELAHIEDEQAISIMKFSPDCKLLLTVTGRFLKVRDAQTLQRLDDIKARTTGSVRTYGQVLDAHFSPDSTTIVTLGNLNKYAGFIEWWRIDSGCLSPHQVFRLNANVQRIMCSPQFNTFVTVDEVGTIHILEKVHERVK